MKCACPLQRRQQRRLVPGFTRELFLLRLLFGSVRLFAAQAHVTIESQLKCAIRIFEQFIDNRTFPGSFRLEERDLALMFEHDDFSQYMASDRRHSNKMGGTFLDNFASGANTRSKEQSGVAGLEFKPLPRLSTRERDFSFRIYRNDGSRIDHGTVLSERCLT